LHSVLPFSKESLARLHELNEKRFMTNGQCKWCENKPISRGLCQKHYARAKALALDGASWEAILAGDEPNPAKRGRKIKQGSASWLAEKYDQLSADVARAIAFIEQGNTDEAKRVLMGRSNNAT
jgi:hypothetical protein